MEKVQRLVNLLKDGLLLTLLVLLLVVPTSINGLLIRAGFTRASIVGFEWEKQVKEAIGQTQAAQAEVKTLHEQLQGYQVKLDQLGQLATEPALRLKVAAVAKDFGHTVESARRVDTRLTETLQSQNRTHSELRARLQ